MNSEEDQTVAQSINWGTSWDWRESHCAIWLTNTILSPSSRRGNGLHKAVDLVCDDYAIINAPFSGNLAGPVSRRDPEGNRYDGVKLLSDGEEEMMKRGAQDWERVLPWESIGYDNDDLLKWPCRPKKKKTGLMLNDNKL